MSFTDEDGIAKKLKAPVNDNIWLIYGDDGFLKDHYCAKLVDACVSDELKFFNFHTYNDNESSLDDIFAAADNLPVMSDRTCLLVRNYPLCELGKNQLAEFKKKLEQLPETTVIIFFYNTIELTDGRNIVSKWSDAVNLLAGKGIAVNLSHRSQNKIVKTLVSRASSRGTVIGTEEAQYLIAVAGDDMQILLNEFNKVCAFANGKPVTKEMIDQTAVKSIEANVFDISAAILSGNTDKAFAVTAELLRTKTPVQPIIGAIAGTFVNLYRYKTASDARRGVDDFASAFGYKGNYGYTFRQLSPFLRSVSENGLRMALDALLETDVKTKSTAFDPSTLMSELIARLAECCKAG